MKKLPFPTWERTAQYLPSEPTYPHGMFADDFLFRKVGYVSFVVGTYLVHTVLPPLFLRIGARARSICPFMNSTLAGESPGSCDFAQKAFAGRRCFQSRNAVIPRWGIKESEGCTDFPTNSPILWHSSWHQDSKHFICDCMRCTADSDPCRGFRHLRSNVLMECGKQKNQTGYKCTLKSIAVCEWLDRSTSCVDSSVWLRGQLFAAWWLSKDEQFSHVLQGVPAVRAPPWN